MKDMFHIAFKIQNIWDFEDAIVSKDRKISKKETCETFTTR